MIVSSKKNICPQCWEKSELFSKFCVACPWLFSPSLRAWIMGNRVGRLLNELHKPHALTLLCCSPFHEDTHSPLSLHDAIQIIHIIVYSLSVRIMKTNAQLSRKCLGILCHLKFRIQAIRKPATSCSYLISLKWDNLIVWALFFGSCSEKKNSDTHP